MKKSFSPLLAPNQLPDLTLLKYPLLGSYKLDGIRILFYKGKIYTRSLKELPNRQLREKFEPLRKYSEENNIILDGEIYSPELTFQEITSFVMTQDFEDKKSVKKFGKVMTIPDHLKFYCFDCLHEESPNIGFKDRFINAGLVIEQFPNISKLVDHWESYSISKIESKFQDALEDGYEGLILRDPQGRYKYGRGSIKEGIIYKVKPFKSIEGKIKGVVQATEVDPHAEKTINELGRSVTSKKKNDRILINKASAFVVDYKGKNLKVTLSMTDEEKEEVWKNQNKYIGKYVEYKYLEIGMKESGLPRHPTTIRMRYDKD